MPSSATASEKEAQLQLLRPYEMLLLLWFPHAFCTVLGLSWADAASCLSGVKSTHQNRDSYISWNPNMAFLLPLEAAACLPSLSLCPLSMCTSTRCAANSISPPKINLSN